MIHLLTCDARLSEETPVIQHCECARCHAIFAWGEAARPACCRGAVSASCMTQMRAGTPAQVPAKRPGDCTDMRSERASVQCSACEDDSPLLRATCAARRAQCLCKTCARVLLSADDAARFLRAFRSARLERSHRAGIFKRVLEACKKRRLCPACGAPNLTVKCAPGSCACRCRRHGVCACGCVEKHVLWCAWAVHPGTGAMLTWLDTHTGSAPRAPSHCHAACSRLPVASRNLCGTAWAPHTGGDRRRRPRARAGRLRRKVTGNLKLVHEMYGSKAPHVPHEVFKQQFVEAIAHNEEIDKHFSKARRLPPPARWASIGGARAQPRFWPATGGGRGAPGQGPAVPSRATAGSLPACACRVRACRGATILASAGSSHARAAAGAPSTRARPRRRWRTT